ncbi:hypothetical protein ACJX0J_035876, partial [Zea mays]
MLCDTEWKYLSHIHVLIFRSFGGGGGGLQNSCLLSKWLFRLINEQGIWQSILQNNLMWLFYLLLIKFLCGTYRNDVVFDNAQIFVPNISTRAFRIYANYTVDKLAINLKGTKYDYPFGVFFIERKVRASEFHKNSIKFHMKLIRKYKKKNVGFMKAEPLKKSYINKAKIASSVVKVKKREHDLIDINLQEAQLFDS